MPKTRRREGTEEKKLTVARALEEIGQEVAALPGTYPIEVFVGDRVVVDRVTFQWKGPAQSIYICWGLKKEIGNFNNGANLEAGAFAKGIFSVPDAVNFVNIDKVVNAVLEITSDMRTNRTYDTYIWNSSDGTANEASFIGPIDNDVFIVTILPAVGHVQELEVHYKRL